MLFTRDMHEQNLGRLAIAPSFYLVMTDARYRGTVPGSPFSFVPIPSPSVPVRDLVDTVHVFDRMQGRMVPENSSWWTKNRDNIFAVLDTVNFARSGKLGRITVSGKLSGGTVARLGESVIPAEDVQARERVAYSRVPVMSDRPGSAPDVHLLMLRDARGLEKLRDFYTEIARRAYADPVTAEAARRVFGFDFRHSSDVFIEHELQNQKQASGDRTDDQGRAPAAALEGKGTSKPLRVFEKSKPEGDSHCVRPRSGGPPRRGWPRTRGPVPRSGADNRRSGLRCRGHGSA